MRYVSPVIARRSTPGYPCIQLCLQPHASHSARLDTNVLFVTPQPLLTGTHQPTLPAHRLDRPYRTSETATLPMMTFSVDVSRTRYRANGFTFFTPSGMLEMGNPSLAPLQLCRTHWDARPRSVALLTEDVNIVANSIDRQTLMPSLREPNIMLHLLPDICTPSTLPCSRVHPAPSPSPALVLVLAKQAAACSRSPHYSAQP